MILDPDVNTFWHQKWLKTREQLILLMHAQLMELWVLDYIIRDEAEDALIKAYDEGIIQ